MLHLLCIILFQIFFHNIYSLLYFFLSASQDCDQIHIDDVSSDDNGQDLRYGVSQAGSCRTGSPQTFGNSRGLVSDSQTCTGSMLSAFIKHTHVESPLSHIIVPVSSVRP